MPFEPLQRWQMQWQELSQERRFAVGVLLLTGVGVLGFSVAYMKLHVSAPFALSVSSLKKSTEQYNALFAKNNTDLELRKKDTDRDGLNDYSELKIYRTSPYLPDSDSDGMTDALEIAQGQDPTCHKGVVCLSSLNSDRASTSTNEDLLDEALSPIEQFILEAPEPDKVDVAQKKEYLLKTGYVTLEELNELPDAQINTIYASAYQEILTIRNAIKNKQAPTSTITNTSNTSASSSQPPTTN